MKIYISAPVKSRAELKDFYDGLDYLSKEGHKLIDIYKDTQYPLPEDVDFLVSKFKESEKAIREADMAIVEVTYPGRRIGFEIARALDEKKVVLALYRDDAKDSSAVATLKGNTYKNFILKPYNSTNIIDVVKDGLQTAKEQLDTKFILIISPEIDRYLQWASEERRMHKAQLVRNAVEDMMDKDKDYKNHLKALGL